MEIVLAIGLTSVVMYLLMTAIELYMLRVDSSRSRVETAQLARAILDQMAADITATRLHAPQQGGIGGSGGGGFSVGGGPGAGGQSAGGNSGGQSPGGGPGGGSSAGGVGGQGAGSSGGAGSSSVAAPASVQGIFGTAEELRIDRNAYPNWARAARQVTAEEPATVADMPVTVRYFLADGDQQTSQQLAMQGVGEELTDAVYAGLYREVCTTASMEDVTDPLASPTQRDGVKLELLAPEVVKMEINYFDGQQLVEVWDSFDERGLPAGVDIRLTMYEPSLADSLEEDQQVRSTGQPRYRESELVEYRRFVRLPKISPAQPAEPLMPVAGAGGQQQAIGPGANGGGQNNGVGGGQNGGGQGGGTGGGGNNRNGGGGGNGN